MTFRLVATMVVRDEVDLIAGNLDHLLHQGVDRVLVTDNGSRDGTREVLAWYADHEPVDVHDEPVGAFLQSQWVTRMACEAAGDGATWVLHVDADEFPLHPTMSLRDFFASIDETADVVRVPRTDYVAVDGAVGDIAPITQTIRKQRSLNPEGLPLAPKVAHRAHVHAVVAAGNHSVAGPGLVREATPHELLIHHFPARSLDQAMRKIVHLSDGHLASGLYHSQSVGTAAVGRRQMIDGGTFPSEYWRIYARDAAALTSGLDSGELIDDTSVRDALVEARGVESGTLRDVVSTTTTPPPRDAVVSQLQGKALLRSIRELIDGAMVLFGSLELAQTGDATEERAADELDILVSDARAVGAILRRHDFDVVGELDGGVSGARTLRFGGADTPATVWVWDSRDALLESAPSGLEVIARARPSRTGIDRVMRPTDAHHETLLARCVRRNGHTTRS